MRSGRTHAHGRLHHGGFTYTEVLVTTFLIAIVLVPAIEGLSIGVSAGGVHVEKAMQQMRLIDAMEHVLAQPFDDLATAADAAAGHDVIVSAYSDAAGMADRRLVYLSRYDGDDAEDDGNVFTGTDDNLLWARVVIEGSPSELETLIAR